MPPDEFVITQPLVGQSSVGNQHTWRSRRATLDAAGVKEGKPARDEVQGSGVWPDLVLEPLGISPGKYQRQAIPVVNALGQPVAGFGAVGWIAPDQPLPW